MQFRTEKAHPWHGIDIGDDAPDEVTVFIEIVPGDTVKYEIDKASGYLKIDRPQKYSNIVPANYGFIPRTYCGAGIARLAKDGGGADAVVEGDGDPLDVLVLSEHHIPRGDIILKARPIGGLCLIDGGQADDKIISVLKGDKIFGEYDDVDQLPTGVLDRIRHYFLTYKSLPGTANACAISRVYGRSESLKVINTAIEDYRSLVGQ